MGLRAQRGACLSPAPQLFWPTRGVARLRASANGADSQDPEDGSRKDPKFDAWFEKSEANMDKIDAAAVAAPSFLDDAILYYKDGSIAPIADFKGRSVAIFYTAEWFAPGPALRSLDVALSIRRRAQVPRVPRLPPTAERLRRCAQPSHPRLVLLLQGPPTARHRIRLLVRPRPAPVSRGAPLPSREERALTPPRGAATTPRPTPRRTSRRWVSRVRSAGGGAAASGLWSISTPR
jgi:hypothetical protein